MSLGSLLSDTIGVFDPLQRRMFTASFPNLLLPDDYIQAIDIPIPSITSIQQTQRGFKVNYPVERSLSSPTCGVLFYEDQNLPVLNYFMQWSSQVVDLSTYTFNVPAFYKRPVTISLLNSLGVPAAIIGLMGCYPASLSGYSMRLGDSSPVYPEFRLWVDAVEVQILLGPLFDIGNLTLGNINNMSSLAGLSLYSGINGGGIPASYPIANVTTPPLQV